jgi:hypothetical protein
MNENSKGKKMREINNKRLKAEEINLLSRSKAGTSDKRI